MGPGTKKRYSRNLKSSPLTSWSAFFSFFFFFKKKKIVSEQEIRWGDRLHLSFVQEHIRWASNICELKEFFCFPFVLNLTGIWGQWATAQCT